MQKVLLALILTTALSAALADSIEVSRCQNPKDRKSLLISRGQSVLITLSDGHRAAVQFTDTGSSYAAYQWRYRASPDATVLAGSGRVFEDYDRVKQPNGGFQLTRKNKPEDLKVRAGEIRLEWSYHNKDSGYLYYCPDRAKLQLIPSNQFESTL